MESRGHIANCNVTTKWQMTLIICCCHILGWWYIPPISHLFQFTLHVIQTLMMHVVITFHINHGEQPLHFSHVKQGPCCGQWQCHSSCLLYFNQSICVEYIFNGHWLSFESMEWPLTFGIVLKFHVESTGILDSYHCCGFQMESDILLELMGRVKYWLYSHLQKGWW